MTLEERNKIGELWTQRLTGSIIRVFNEDLLKESGIFMVRMHANYYEEIEFAGPFAGIITGIFSVKQPEEWNDKMGIFFQMIFINRETALAEIRPPLALIVPADLDWDKFAQQEEYIKI